MDLITTEDWKRFKDKLVQDLCSAYCELEYFKKRSDSGLIVKLNNGTNTDAQAMVDNLERIIPILREKIEIINNFIGI